MRQIPWILTRNTADTSATFSDDVIDAAWEAGVGVYALIWVGHCMASTPDILLSVDIIIVRIR